MAEFVFLGTSSQRPTRNRNHNGYLVRWDGVDLLVDPGEGTQRQFTFAGLSAAKVRHIFLTHLHGDHCLGLPGVLQRMHLDGVSEAVEVHYPESGHEYVERLIDSSIAERVGVVLRPVPEQGADLDVSGLTVTALPLSHRVPTVGWRFEEPSRRHLVPERLAEFGISGPDAGRILEHGHLRQADQVVHVDQVSEVRSGRSVAVVMDTAMCDNAITLCRNVDLAVIEATYLEAEADLAERYAHLTATQAGQIAADAGAQQLVLTHFSSRYADTSAHVDEVSRVFAEVLASEDFMSVTISSQATR